MGVGARQIVALIVLDFLALLLNVWLLYTIRSRKKVFNAIGVLQICKTIMVILAIAMLVWLEFIDCGRKPAPKARVCLVLSEALENLLLHSVCWTFLAVAIVRRKVCECQGQASVLVTPRYALRVLCLCLVPVVSFIVVTTFMTLGIKGNDNGDQNRNDSLPVADYTLITVGGSSTYAYRLAQVILINGLPLLTGTAVYAYILNIVRQTVRNVTTSVNRKRKTSNKIISSIVVLTVINSAMWWPYIILRVVSLHVSISEYVFVYWKVFVLIAHPFGEGLLQSYMQTIITNRTLYIHKRLMRKHAESKANSKLSQIDEEGPSPHTTPGLCLSVVLVERDVSNSAPSPDHSRSPPGTRTTRTHIEQEQHGGRRKVSRNCREFQQYYDDGGKPVLGYHAMSDVHVETLAFNPEATGWTHSKVSVHTPGRDRLVEPEDAAHLPAHTGQHPESQRRPSVISTQPIPTMQQRSSASQLPSAASCRWKKAMPTKQEDVIEVEIIAQPTESTANRRKSTFGKLWSRLFTATKVVRTLSSLQTPVTELSTVESRRRTVRQRNKTETLDIPRKRHSYKTVYARDDSELNATGRYGFGSWKDLRKSRSTVDGKTRHISVSGVPGAYLTHQRDSRPFFTGQEVRAEGRDSTGSGPHSSTNKRKKHWLQDATKDECIAKLEDLNDYF